MVSEIKSIVQGAAERYNYENLSENEATIVRLIEASEPKIHLRQLRSKANLFSDIAPIDAPRVHNNIIIEIPPQFTMTGGLSPGQEFDLNKELTPPDFTRSFRYKKTAYCALHIYED